jgi:type I restriction enzyme S subunit
MSKYQAYPEYKESCISWIGAVPETWEPSKLKWILTEKHKTLSPELPAGSISFGKVIYKNEDNLAPETKASYQEVLNGEFLINPLNMNFDLKSLRTALSSIDVVVSTGYLVVKAVNSVDKRYIRWLLQQFDVAHMKTLGSGVRQTINFSDIANCVCFFSDITEQTQIAAFLDHETAKIDSLIEKQQQLIELLKEKRQAVISHAVTKGLNPDAPMKDSGIEWLGEVPKHWIVLNIQRVLHKIEQGSSPVAQNRTPQQEEFGVLKISSVKKGVFHAQESKTLDSITQYESRFRVTKGDLLVTRANTPSLVADACVVNQEPSFPIMMCDLIYRLVTTDKVDNHFLCMWLLSDFGRMQVEADARGSSMTMAKVSQGHIKAWLTVLPPLSEQNEIVAYLEHADKQFSQLTYKAEKAIELMQERRTALISAAVTGKIDVRDWVAPTTSSDANETVQKVNV